MLTTSTASKEWGATYCAAQGVPIPSSTPTISGEIGDPTLAPNSTTTEAPEETTTTWTNATCHKYPHCVRPLDTHRQRYKANSNAVRQPQQRHRTYAISHPARGDVQWRLFWHGFTYQYWHRTKIYWCCRQTGCQCCPWRSCLGCRPSSLNQENKMGLGRHR